LPASGKTANDGAVFSVDAMNFIGALPIDNYDSAARSFNTHKV
jgi:N,N-dimethylformamidase